MRAIAQETASQIACSKEDWEKVRIYGILVKEKYVQSSTYFFQKASASLVKLSASHEERLSL